LARTLILMAAATLQLCAQVPDAAQIQKVTAEIADITGLAVKRPVPFEAISREAWKKWVADEIQATVKPAELRAEEIALKKFGLVPKDFDLKKATVDLLGEQAAALYDHRRKKMLFVEGGAEGEMAEAVLVHELSHALADQHFDMKRFLEKGPKSDEAQTARMAVVEGQAMWIMIESQMRKVGMSLKGNRGTLDVMLPAMGKMAAESYPVFTSAPLYLRETLLFPYTAGLLFQQAVFEKSGKGAFAEVLRKPPASTQQVLQPERYFEALAPTQPALPAMDGLKEFDHLTTGSVGELDFRILLQQYTEQKQGSEVAAKWRGGTFDVLEHKKDKHTVLRWAVDWDSPETARQFVAMYRKVLDGKWKVCRFAEETNLGLKGTGDDGEFAVRLDGSRVSGIEGMQRTEGATRQGQ